MALIQYSALVSAVKGSVGGTTFSTNRAGSIAKSRLTGKRSRTRSQANALSSSMLVTAYWSLITPAQRVLWNDYALANTYTNRYGQVKPLTGYQWFKSINQFMLFFNSEVSSEPPLYQVPAALPQLSLTASADDLVASWLTPVNPSTTKVSFWVTGPIRSLATSNRGRYVLIDLSGIDYSNSFSIKDKWEQANGLDYSFLAAAGEFNICVKAFPVHSVSMVSGVFQLAVGSRTP